MLFRPWNVRCTFTLTLSAVCVQCPIRQSPLNFVLSRYVTEELSEWFLNGSSPLIITHITFAFTFHMRWVSVMGPLYLKIFSTSSLITFLSPEIVVIIIIIMQTCNKMNWVIRRHFGKQINKESKSRIHNITAKAALKFGSEAWVLKKREEERLQAAQMKFLRDFLEKQN